LTRPPAFPACRSAFSGR